MKKAQLFSVDFLVAVAVLTIALGLWLNSFSQIQKNAEGSVANASSFAIASVFYERLSAGAAPSELGCSENAQMVYCEQCVSGSKYYVQRVYSAGAGARLLKVGVCA